MTRWFKKINAHVVAGIGSLARSPFNAGISSRKVVAKRRPLGTSSIGIGREHATDPRMLATMLSKEINDRFALNMNLRADSKIVRTSCGLKLHAAANSTLLD